MSEMTLNQALTELDKLGNLGRAIAKTSEAVVALRGSEQLVRERQKAAEELGKQLTHGAEQLTNLQAQIRAAEQQAEEIMASAKHEAAALVSDAKDKIRVAAAKAKQKVDEAEARAADLTAQASAAEAQLAVARDDLVTTRQTIEQELSTARKKLGG